jgi:hypothetical protein
LHVFFVQQLCVIWLQTPPGHIPHETVPWQPSGKVPHSMSEKLAQVLGSQGGPQTPLELQTSPIGHWPQLIICPPHALTMLPQLRPSAAHSTGVTVGSHWLATPTTPQLCPAGQPSPETPSQSTVPPQPLVMMPHCAPAAMQRAAAVPGTQLGSQMLKTLLQTSVPGHDPQSV